MNLYYPKTVLFKSHICNQDRYIVNFDLYLSLYKLLTFKLFYDEKNYIFNGVINHFNRVWANKPTC